MDSNAATGNQRHQGAADAVTSAIIGSAIEVLRELGPGLLESSCEACLAHELATRASMLSDSWQYLSPTKESAWTAAIVPIYSSRIKL